MRDARIDILIYMLYVIMSYCVAQMTVGTFFLLFGEHLRNWWNGKGFKKNTY